MIRVNPNKYIDLFTDTPNMEMTLSGWEYSIRYYLFYTFPVVIYTKQAKF